jgi:hypothetical protein
MNENIKAALVGGGYGLAGLIFLIGIVNTMAFVMKIAGQALGCST